MIEYVTLDRAGELDSFVEAHPRGHLMQSSVWGRVKTDWLWHGILYRDNRGRVRGTLALLEHPGRLPGSCLLYGPRGPIFEDEQSFRVLVNAAKELGRERGAWQITNLMNTRIGIILLYTATQTPFNVFLIHSFVSKISPEIDEAAVLDGASPS